MLYVFPFGCYSFLIFLFLSGLTNSTTFEVTGGGNGHHISQVEQNTAACLVIDFWTPFSAVRSVTAVMKVPFSA